MSDSPSNKVAATLVAVAKIMQEPPFDLATRKEARWYEELLSSVCSNGAQNNEHNCCETKIDEESTRPSQ